LGATPKILVVDDDERICQMLARYLKREGYETVTATSGERMRAHVAAQPFDLVLLDLMLPGEDGFALARELRAQSSIPIIILSGRSDTVDKVVGLELGADDYVTKPFEERELLARVRSVLRRYADRPAPRPGTRKVACFSGWRLDLGADELYSPANEKVHLTSFEFDILAALLTQPGQVLSRDVLLQKAANREWDPTDRSIDVAIGKLRKKIEQDPASPALIKAVRSKGYKFTGKVEYR